MTLPHYDNHLKIKFQKNQSHKQKKYIAKTNLK